MYFFFVLFLLEGAGGVLSNYSIEYLSRVLLFRVFFGLLLSSSSTSPSIYITSGQF